jgi:type IV pilus assembly protein PilV
MPTTFHRRGQRGFTLVEVLVALLVTAVGLLGLLKIQALAISSTKEAGSRGLVAMQVESLTAMMHANPFYWAAAVPAGGVTSGPPPGKITVTGATVGAPFAAAGSTCTGASVKCTPMQLAGADVQQWAATMYQQFPTYNATINCDSTSLPVTCFINVNWQETQVAAHATTAQGKNIQTTTLSFSVYVQP